MNNPLRAAIQRRFEAGKLRRMGGDVAGGTVLEIGCGRGVGAKIIVNEFHARRVDAFDLDPRMVARARQRLAPHRDRVRLWVGDATAIPVCDATYDAVFDFGILHHVPGWRQALHEVSRVLKPGGSLYAEEVLSRLICHPLARRLFHHPQRDRFDRATFCSVLKSVDLEPRCSEELLGSFVWVFSRKPG